MLFRKIYEKSKGSDQEERFKDAKSQLDKIKYLFKKESNIEIVFNNFENIFEDIKEELSKKEESKSDEFIKQMENYFDKKNEETKKDLSILIKSKKYEMIVKSIKFFFENFSNKKLILPKHIELSEMDLKDLKRTLKILKDDIYMIMSLIALFIKYLLHFMIKKKQ